MSAMFAGTPASGVRSDQHRQSQLKLKRPRLRNTQGELGMPAY
jgi:hypothetical protein